MKRIYWVLSLTLLLASCKKLTTADLTRDQVFKKVVSNVELGDGAPIGVELSVRWRIKDKNEFLSQFPDAKTYDSLILAPRERELINQVANTFKSIDSVFTSERKFFITRIKDILMEDMGETSVEIKEVIVSDLIFPVSFTKSMEQVALKERELETIRLQNVADREQALARELKAKADGKATIEAAKVDGEIAKMNARIEKEKRLAKIAEAETEARVEEIQARSEAKKLQILADRKLQEKRDLNDLELEKSTKVNSAVLAHDSKIASVYSQNPVYANYLVNKELASKVHIAVVPPGSDVSSLLQQVTLNPVPEKKEVISEEIVEPEEEY